jgi:hypothetical protein
MELGPAFYSAVLLLGYHRILFPVYRKSSGRYRYTVNENGYFNTHLSTFLIWYGFILIGLVLLEVAMLTVYPGINLIDSLFRFITYEEWGIPQGVVLLPLIFLLNWQQYKLVFLRTGEYTIFPTELHETNSDHKFWRFCMWKFSSTYSGNFRDKDEQFLLWIIVLGRLVHELWLHPSIVRFLVKKAIQ